MTNNIDNKIGQSPMTHTGNMPWDNIFYKLYKDKKSKIEHFEYKIVNQQYLTEVTTNDTK